MNPQDPDLEKQLQAMQPRLPGDLRDRMMALREEIAVTSVVTPLAKQSWWSFPTFAVTTAAACLALVVVWQSSPQPVATPEAQTSTLIEKASPPPSAQIIVKKRKTVSIADDGRVYRLMTKKSPSGKTRHQAVALNVF